MNLLETILKSGNGSLVKQLAGNLGLGDSDALNAIKHLTPALTKALGKQTEKPDGLNGLLGALKTGNHGRYIDDPGQLNREESITDGNAILGHILGSKEVSRKVAGQAAEQTGISGDLLKKMLPMLGAVVMGSLSKQTSGGGMLESLMGGGGKAGGGGLSSFLDADGDGSVADDLFSMAKKLF